MLFDTAARWDLLLVSDQFLLIAALRSTFALRLLTGCLNQKEFDVTDRCFYALAQHAAQKGSCTEPINTWRLQLQKD